MAITNSPPPTPERPPIDGMPRNREWSEKCQECGEPVELYRQRGQCRACWGKQHTMCPNCCHGDHRYGEECRHKYRRLNCPDCGGAGLITLAHAAVLARCEKVEATLSCSKSTVADLTRRCAELETWGREAQWCLGVMYELCDLSAAKLSMEYGLLARGRALGLDKGEK